MTDDNYPNASAATGASGCYQTQRNPDGHGHCRCFRPQGHDGPHRCCGGVEENVHEWPSGNGRSGGDS